jgi:serine/threonine protein kinase
VCHARARTPTVRGASRRFRPVPRATATSSDASSSTEPFTLGLRRDAEDALVLGEPIGRGAMGVVRSCTRRSDGCRFALKTIPKAGPQSLEGSTPTGDAMSIWERKVRDEVNLHFALGASLDIVTLHDAFEDEAGVHLLIDLCDGGDLLTGTSNENEDDDEEEEEVQQVTRRPTQRTTLGNNTSSSKRKKSLGSRSRKPPRRRP